MKDYAKVESWMSDDEKLFRYGIDNLVNTVNNKHLLDKSILDYQVFDSGLSSVVLLANIDSETGPFIFKTTSEPEKVISEARALNHWSQVVTTPEIYSVHLPDGDCPVAFFTAEQITKSAENKESALRLKEVPATDRIKSGLSEKIGHDLALTHSLDLPDDTTGFGVLKNTDIVESTKKTFSKLKRDGVIGETVKPLVDNSLEIISKQPDSDAKLCHNDFLPYNLLIREDGTIVVFDPDAAINNPVADLANTILNTLVEAEDYGEPEAIEILKGYESVKEVNYNILQAYFVYHCVRKIYRWQQKDRPKKVSATISLLNEPPAFLRKNK